MNAHPTNIEAAKLLRENWSSFSNWTDDQIRSDPNNERIPNSTTDTNA